MSSPAAGSSLWQLVFISIGCLLIILEVLRGWRRGVARQLARLGALIAAYFIGWFGGNLLGPWGRIFVQLPNQVLSALVGVILGCLVYVIITGLGTALFRRTSQHESHMVRIVYGAGGAFLGIFFGAFLVWLMVVAVRSLGAVADGQVETESSNVPHLTDRRIVPESEPESSWLALMARMKNSIELGPIGSVVKKADVVPAQTYDTLGRVSRVLSDPENAQRFLSYPGARQLADNPKIVALRDDPEITQMLTDGRLLELIQNEKILDAANDPNVIKTVKAFDLNGALEFALGKKDGSHGDR